ncbi:MAG: UDP-N-acetylglucosamine 2-epimerase (non-hydrolyzing) [Thermoleophilia bacterium]|nr:UDP-N-acetylglucosamine 2-epimerase (non-hydrolyzing) [Thermoleophilia bacterium]MDH3724178.1 UDP-N-acetylglucosamine 2-epimerase (non-hydrolyzing) [Thermoleophilia bacterium]
MIRPLFIVGTRPGAIKVAPVVRATKEHPALDPIMLASGQHPELVRDALATFALRADAELDLGPPSGGLDEMAARLLDSLSAAIDRVRPDVVVVLGDTTTAAMGAQAAFYGEVPIWHIEAGLRTSAANRPFPEEMHRRLISRLATVHLAPTASARQNLLSEGIADSQIMLTGNTVVDALQFVVAQRATAANPTVASLIDSPGPVAVVTMHRRENWHEGIRRVACATLRLLDRRPELRVVHSAHPNPIVRNDVHALLDGHPRAVVTAPLEYGDFALLLARAKFAITDSGGIQEEAPSLGTPVLVARRETERTEGLRAGVAMLVGTDEDRIVADAERLLDGTSGLASTVAQMNPYGDGRAGQRIAHALATRLANVIVLRRSDGEEPPLAAAGTE